MGNDIVVRQRSPPFVLIDGTIDPPLSRLHKVRAHKLISHFLRKLRFAPDRWLIPSEAHWSVRIRSRWQICLMPAGM
jgi:hypothetical protein